MTLSKLPRSTPPAGAVRASAAASAARPVPPSGRLDWRLLLRWLVEDNLVRTPEATRVARRFEAGDSSLHALVRLGGAGLEVEGRPLDTEALTEWLARRFGLGYLRIDPLKVDVGRVADVMSIQYAERRFALPVQWTATEVVIATAEPFDAGWVAEIEAHTRKAVRLLLANPVDVKRYTTEFYSISRSVRAAQKSGESSASANFEQLVELGRSNRQLDANDQGVVQVVDWLWQYAFDQRASDIHLEPRREMGAIRFRIDGVLHTVYQLPLGVMNAMIARVKLLGRMDVVERRRPLDGRIKTRRPEGVAGAGSEVEMRLSTLPTAFGEKMVMRIFSPENATKSLQALGFAEDDSQRWQQLIARPHGIVLVTGPTGSGKTTTLYSTLKSLATDEVNVCTIEDPIEMIEPAFNQTQVHGAVDLGFAEGLRALMRQDPDIIMVGEIRDLPTAEMAIQAALTGHLVFSTLHTNDAVGAVTRLIDLGVPPYLVSATVIGVLAQRLVRTVCPACRVRDESLTRASLEAFVKPWRVTGSVKGWRAVGCLECRHTGYRGRAGLYELLVMNEQTQACIHPQPDPAALRAQGARDGMHPLRLSGVMAVAEGRTTLDEVLRSTPALD
ncbi:MAG: type II/IV secretion system protein [Rubrivivax sp.]|nr:type II/IV secretion system protein [Rubrivivax sp.]